MPEVARMSVNASPALFKYTNGPFDNCRLPVGTIIEKAVVIDVAPDRIAPGRIRFRDQTDFCCHLEELLGDRYQRENRHEPGRRRQA